MPVTFCGPYLGTMATIILIHCSTTLHTNLPPSLVKNISLTVTSPLPLLVNPATDTM